MEPIYTPKTDIPFNFGPSSNRDETLYTAERPGNPGKGEMASTETVKEWIAFMKGKGVGHVIALLDENEFGVYEEPGLLEFYKEGDLEAYVTPMGEEGAFDKIMGIIKDIEAKGEKAVTHCTGGTGRAGRVAAAWLATKYELSAEDATKEAVDTAIETGVHRLGNAEKLAGWMS